MMAMSTRPELPDLLFFLFPRPPSPSAREDKPRRPFPDPGLQRYVDGCCPEGLGKGTSERTGGASPGGRGTGRDHGLIRETGAAGGFGKEAGAKGRGWTRPRWAGPGAGSLDVPPACVSGARG